MVSITIEEVALGSTKMKQLHVRMEDAGEADLLGELEKIFEFMEGARQDKTAVLVHCEAGISRSATTVIAYLVKYHNMSLLEAFEFTKTRRTSINPNAGFVEQLRRFESSVRSGSPSDPFQFVLYWLRNYVHILNSISEDEVRQLWDSSQGNLLATRNALYDTFEQRYLAPSVNKNQLHNVPID